MRSSASGSERQALGPHEGDRVDRVGPGGPRSRVHLEVQVRPGRRAGRTDVADDLTLGDGLADHDRVINNPRDSLLEGTKVRATEMPAHADKKDAPKPAVAPTEKSKS